MFNTEFDPLQLLQDLADNQAEHTAMTNKIIRQVNEQAVIINQLVQMFNELNRRVTICENESAEHTIKLHDIANG